MDLTFKPRLDLDGTYRDLENSGEIKMQIYFSLVLCSRIRQSNFIYPIPSGILEEEWARSKEHMAGKCSIACGVLRKKGRIDLGEYQPLHSCSVSSREQG